MPRDDQAAVMQAVDALHGLDLGGLRGAWTERFGSAPQHRSPELLRRQLAWRMQTKAWGDLDAATRALLLRPILARADLPAVGVRLVREWKGQRHEVEIGSDQQVIYHGAVYASLSEVARVITGVRWNGPRFFGLRGRS